MRKHFPQIVHLDAQPPSWSLPDQLHTPAQVFDRKAMRGKGRRTVDVDL
jgi:hypothetical protein